jgi:putative membrane protein
MRNAWRLFVGDLKRLRSNVITGIVVLGLIALPSLFSWFNMLACWDVFDNTGNLTVAVANSDEGYESDLVPIRVNIGENVMSALRENEQMNWYFTTEEDAVEGVRAGRYYAAVVIPATFSRDMMSFYSDDVEHAAIIYYSNEKKSAIAPRVTDQGADQIVAQVNRTFAETLGSTALSIVSALSDYADNADASGRIAALGAHVQAAGEQMSHAASTLRAYADMLSLSRQLVASTGSLVSTAQQSGDEIAGRIAEARSAAESVTSALDTAVASLSEAIAQSAEGYDAMSEAIDQAFDMADSASGDAAAALRDRAAVVDGRAAAWRQIVDRLDELADQLDEEDAAAVQPALERMRSAAAVQEQLRDALYAAADEVERRGASTQEQRAEAKAFAEQAAQHVRDAKADYDENLKPSLDRLSVVVAQQADALRAASNLLSEVEGDIISGAGSVSNALGDAYIKLDNAATTLESSSQKLQDLGKRMVDALAEGDTSVLREILGSDPHAYASLLAAPVAIDRHAVYPVENFGSAMSPLYTPLALWIGALLIMVALKLNPSERTLRSWTTHRRRRYSAGASVWWRCSRLPRARHFAWAIFCSCMFKPCIRCSICCVSGCRGSRSHSSSTRWFPCSAIWAKRFRSSC